MSRNVFDNRMVAHVWAQGRQESGRSNNGQFYFEGPTLYSYGAHFVVAFRDAHGATLLNGDSYSRTTAKHVGMARRAAIGVRLTVPKLTALVPTLKLLAGDVGGVTVRACAPVLRAHVAANLTGMDDDAAIYLLRAAGERDPAAAVARLRAKAAKEAFDAKALTAKLERAGQLRFAATVAAMSPAERRQFATGAGCTYADVGDLLDERAKQLRAGQRACKVAGFTKRAALLGDVLKMLRGERERSIRAHDRRRARQSTQGVVATVRNVLAIHAAGGGVRSHGWAQLRTSARELLRRHPLWPAKLLDSLRGIEAEAGRRLDVATAAEEAERLAAAAERQRQREEADRQRAEREAANRAAWFAGDPSARLYESARDGSAFVRAVHVQRDAAGAIVGGQLQTSQGATVPLAEAVRVFQFVKLVRERGRPWRRNGATVPVGHFQIDAIDSSGGFTAGCHRFAWAEIERLATQLGVFALPASASAVVESH